MAKWHDPVRLLRDYCALPSPIVALTPTQCLTNYLLVVVTKLLHAIASLYMCAHPHMQKWPTLILMIHTFSWETVFTAGFELNILRGKQPYKWTIWVRCSP